MKGFRDNRWALVSPPTFAMQQEAKNRMATLERKAVDALLEHRATEEDIGRLEQMAECGIRAIRKARKLPHCRHLDQDQLGEAERAMQRGAHAIHRAVERQKATGVYGLDALDRQCIQDFDAWYGAMTERGAIPRAVWIGALADQLHKRGRVVLAPWESLQ